jgi:hypothetical protein
MILPVQVTIRNIEDEGLEDHEPSLHAALQQSGARTRVTSAEVGILFKNPRSAVADAFSEMRWRLQDYVRTRRSKVKTHAEPLLSGTVARPFPEGNYGVLTTPRGEVHFRRANILNGHSTSTVRIVHPRQQARAAARGAVLTRGASRRTWSLAGAPDG